MKSRFVFMKMVIVVWFTTRDLNKVSKSFEPIIINITNGNISHQFL